jgi:uncharacterized membrane protein
VRTTDILVHCFVYGVLGMLVEVFFTGVGSLLHRDSKATCQTYLWMLPVYGPTGLLLAFIHQNIAVTPWSLAPVYVLIIYGAEFCSGWMIRRLIGVCPWDYGRGRWTVMGLIQLKYAPFWFVLALCFNRICDLLQKILDLIARYG